MNTIPQIDVKNVATGLLVAFYNTHSGKPAIKKFVDRKTAEERVTKLLAAQTGEPTTQSAPATTDATTKEAAMAKTPKKPAAKKAAKTKKPAAPKAKMTPEQRAKAIADTWKDEKVAKKRATHNKVSVAGVEYRSVNAAFNALRLPHEKHIAFRLILKKEKAATFKHNDKNFNFKIVTD